MNEKNFFIKMDGLDRFGKQFYGHQVLWTFVIFLLKEKNITILAIKKRVEDHERAWLSFIQFNHTPKTKQNKIRFSIILTDRNEKEKKRSMKIKSNRIPLFIGHAVKQTKTKRTSRSSRSWHLSIIFIWMFCCREQFLFG